LRHVLFFLLWGVVRYKAIHLLGSKADRQFIASNGNLKGKKVQSLISQLTSPSANSKEQYFVLTERHGDLGPGIWRRYRVKNAVSPAFALLDQKPTQDTASTFTACCSRKPSTLARPC